LQPEVGLVALRVRVLGGLDVEGVDVVRLGSRKARTALARLALGRGATVPADELVEILWTGQPKPQRPADQVSVLISRLRAVLGADTMPRVGRGYRLALDWLDRDAVDGLVREARARLTDGRLAPARSAIEAGLSLDRGPLLPDEEPGDWIDAERQAALRASVDLRVLETRLALASADPWVAVEAARAALERDPYEEEAVRLLMRALAGAGRTTLAVNAYLDFRRRLGDELGVDPDPATTASYVELLRGGAAVATAQTRPVGAGLIGRAAEVGLLDDALARVRTGQLVSVLIRGEAGIGKTRLLDFWCDGLRGVTVLRAAGSELSGDLPLQPVLDALATWGRRNPDERTEVLGDSAPVLGPLIGAAPVGESTHRLLDVLGDSSSGGPTLLVAAVDAVIERLTKAGPVVVTVDDGHWLDRATLDWLRHTRTRLADRPLLLVIAQRAGEGTTIPVTVTADLGPLDLAAVTELAGRPRAADLHARSGGHPLFLMELMDASGEDLPASIRDAVDTRCAQTGPAATTLRTAAVLGSEIDLDLLSAVLAEPPGVLLDHLEEGVRRHLLVESGQGFRFRHQLVREALHGSLSPSRATLLHRGAAQSLHARGRRADPLEIAHHARLGGDPVLAARALATAAELAAARFDHDEALRLFDEALEQDASAAIRLSRARAALPAGRFAEAAADAGAALAGGAGAEAMEVAAIAAYLVRDFARCRRLSEDGARLADEPGLRISFLALGGRVCHVDGDLAAAERLLDAARAGAPPELRSLAQLWSAPLRSDRGDPAGALGLLAEPAFAARHPFGVPHRHLARAQALGLLGRADEALAELAQVDAAAAQQRTERFAARADNCRAWILRNLGRAAEADSRNEAAYERSVGAIGMGEPIADALLGLADGRMRAGDVAGARDLLRRVRTEVDGARPFRWRHDLRARLISGRCDVAEGATGAALEAADEIVATATDLGVPRYVVLGECLVAAARRAPVDADRVRAYAALEAAYLGAAGDQHE
jgi:DNA-binding SARP family transcriptional activator/tetratricopeptide (TPR) repeat protein